MNTSGFTAPPPMNRFFGGSRFRTAAITMSSGSEDSSITRLQSLQRTLAKRGKSLRAQGIRGKADEAAEKKRKERERVQIDGLLENPKKQDKQGTENNMNLELKTAVRDKEYATPQSPPVPQSAVMQIPHTKGSSLPQRRTIASKQSRVQHKAEVNGVVSTGTELSAAGKTPQPLQPLSSMNKKRLDSNSAGQASLSIVKNVRGARNMSSDASQAEEIGDTTRALAATKLSRRNGSLPWKHSASTIRSVNANEESTISILDSFTRDQGFTRVDGSLPWLARFSHMKRRTRYEPRIYSGKSDSSLPTMPSTVGSGTEKRASQSPAEGHDSICSGESRGSFVKIGSGMDKRDVLSRRFLYLVKDKGVSPNDIITITISNKNASEIRERIIDRVGGEEGSGMDFQVRTFHSLCLQLLRRYGDVVGVNADFDVCGASDSISVLTPIIKEVTGVSSRSKDMRRYMDLVSKLKQDLNGECQRTWLPVTLEQVNSIRERYDKALQEANQLDFVDIVVNTYKMLHENAHIAKELGAAYKHVLVDDWMGANDLHVNIASILAGKQEDLFVVSDLEWSAFRLETPSAPSNEVDDLANLVRDASKTENSSAESILENLNPTQLEAVVADPNRACLVMAGPGSGKTRVLTHRFAYLVKAHGISPSQILAVTFTNKAANEMKERIEKLVGHDLGSQSLLSIGTFHSICLRILRLYGDRIGIPSGFNVCDTSDSRSLLANLLRKLSGAPPLPRTVGMQRDMISKLKNDSDGVLSMKWQPFVLNRTTEMRKKYDEELRRMNLLDFDDLLVETRRLLAENEDVLADLNEHYRQVLVDEWQDTNTVQFEIVCLLARKRKNLFVVGDIDQSIYKFRGADVKNMRRFHHKFMEAIKVSLDQNYRSTEQIVNAAHAVIVKNREAKKNRMISENGSGRKVQLRGVLTTKKEANFVSETIQSLWDSSEIRSFSDVSILYRTNAQSRAFEEAFISWGFPYRLHSGVRFFERQEVKDIVSYLKVVANVDDDVAFRRVVNTPARGIGKKTLEDIERFASANGCSMADAVVMIFQRLNSGELDLESIGMRTSSARKLGEFYNLLYELRKAAGSLSSNHEDLTKGEMEADVVVNNVGDLVSKIIDSVNYEDYLRQRSASEVTSVGQADKGSERTDNITELRRYAAEFSNIMDFLDNVALVSESDRRASDSNERGSISLMTLHGGKGLEFPVVFIVGAEDNMLPIHRAASPEDVEEERRLFYVGMTRAQKLLFISWRKIESAAQRGKVTSLVDLTRSRFLDDIPSTVAETVYDYENFSHGQTD